MINRDSLVFWLGIAAGLVLYLTGTKPPDQWDWYGWLAFVGYGISVLSAKLASSPLAGANTPQKESYPALGGLVRLSDKEKP